MKFKVGDIVDYEPITYPPLGIIIKNDTTGCTVYWFSGIVDGTFVKEQIMKAAEYPKTLKFIERGNKLILLAIRGIK